jgi:hypothetical protein
MKEEMGLQVEEETPGSPLNQLAIEDCMVAEVVGEGQV